MATAQKRISEYDEIAGLTDGDVVPISQLAGGTYVTKRMNLLQKIISALQGVYARLTVANTFTAAQTFSALINANAGIKFPANAVPSADPNTIDDYEEGDWTPTWTFENPGTFSIANHAARTGAYVKIGRLVIADFVLLVGGAAFTIGTATGEMRITGIPFPSTKGFMGSVKMNGIDPGTTCYGICIEAVSSHAVASLLNPNYFAGPNAVSAINFQGSPHDKWAVGTLIYIV